MPYTVEEIREKTSPIARSFGIRRMSLFGSYARGEAREDSDVDLMIDKGRLRGLLAYFAFCEELESALGCHVDVVSTGIENKEFLASIAGDEVLLYEE